VFVGRCTSWLKRKQDVGEEIEYRDESYKVDRDPWSGLEANRMGGASRGLADNHVPWVTLRANGVR